LVGSSENYKNTAMAWFIHTLDFSCTSRKDINKEKVNFTEIVTKDVFVVLKKA